MFELSPETLVILAGAVLSAVFKYAPKLRQKYDALKPNEKRLVMVVNLLALSIGFFVAGCAGRFSGVTCDAAGVWSLLEIFVLAAIGNQATFLLAPNLKG